MERITDSVTSADGTRIVYHVQGEGAPLVILHGTLAPVDTYYAVADLLAPHYRVVLVERREYGVSENGPRPLDFARQAADVVAVLDAVGEPSFVFGHSCGGVVALHALLTPAKIRRVALYEPPVALAGPALSATLEKARDSMAAGRPGDAIIEFFSTILDYEPPAGMLDGMAAMLAPRAHGLVADLECFTGMDPDLTRWSTLDVPALLLSGELTDSYGTESIDLLQQTIPNARTITFPGLGHTFDDAQPVADALREFFI
ncbi:alpha/beta fold hydrolase [Nocardia sp. NPDC020380]|uniref:alpha/beta fold hydrolase n=1 Tax=Nocardia sp. NPDC020380 TaxID=3364309 RepID=UPI0037881F0F